MFYHSCQGQEAAIAIALLTRRSPAGEGFSVRFSNHGKTKPKLFQWLEKPAINRRRLSTRIAHAPKPECISPRPRFAFCRGGACRSPWAADSAAPYKTKMGDRGEMRCHRLSPGQPLA